MASNVYTKNEGITNQYLQKNEGISRSYLQKNEDNYSFWTVIYFYFLGF